MPSSLRVSVAFCAAKLNPNPPPVRSVSEKPGVWKSCTCKRRIRRHADNRTRDRHGVAIAGFAARRVTLAVEFCGEIVADRDAICREPMIGESQCAGEIQRPPMRSVVDADLEAVAPPGAEISRHAPIGAAAGERKAVNRIRRGAVIHAGGKAVVARRDIAGADHRIAVEFCSAAIGRAPGAPALVEVLLRRRRSEHGVVGLRDIRRQARLLLRRKTRRAAAGRATATPARRIGQQIHKVRHQLERAGLRARSPAGRRVA